MISIEERLALLERNKELLKERLLPEVIMRFSTQEKAQRAVQRLMSCTDHRGSHHFAVIGEGRTVAMTSSAWGCIMTAGDDL